MVCVKEVTYESLKKMVKESDFHGIGSSYGRNERNADIAASTDPNASAKREATNAAISQKAATQGMVLLENNNNSLPIAQTKGTKVALFGVGSYKTIKGGTGSVMFT